MNKPTKSPSFDNLTLWVGEIVTLHLSGGEAVEGKITAAKNGNLIIIPNSGRRQPRFFSEKEISKIIAKPLRKDTLPPVTAETIREHMLKCHAWWSGEVPAKTLLHVHVNLHLVDENIGHIHTA